MGVTYYTYRWYDPLTGRWPSRDPIEEDGGVNLSAFLNNNPLNYNDHLGMIANRPRVNCSCVKVRPCSPCDENDPTQIACIDQLSDILSGTRSGNDLPGNCSCESNVPEPPDCPSPDCLEGDVYMEIGDAP
jgi:uncharacterized protein RhaS with RHS repeats